MVGGGPGADIGPTHRFAMRLDDRYQLVAGVFGRDVARSSTLAEELGIDAGRAYRDHVAMADAECASPGGLDLVVVATPNDSHFEIAAEFLRRGVSVVCEKPLTQDAATAAELVRIAAESGALLAVPHCYSAYAMVRHAARLVRDGRLGRITFVDVEHASGWAATPIESTGHKQAGWRTNPEVAGFPSVVSDLGTHAYHLLRYVTGLDAVQVSGQLHTLVPGRRVYDNATVSLRLPGGVPARLWASMAATGHAHGLRMRVFGDRASLEWHHEDPHHLVLRDVDGGSTTITQGMANLSEDAARITRVGLGHPEGFLEAFANFYRDVADELSARRRGDGSTLRDLSFPTGEDGLRGVQLVEAVARSADADGAWIEMPRTSSRAA
jgi:predicted dehydrogenase